MRRLHLLAFSKVCTIFGSVVQVRSSLIILCVCVCVLRNVVAQLLVNLCFFWFCADVNTMKEIGTLLLNEPSQEGLMQVSPKKYEVDEEGIGRLRVVLLHGQTVFSL